METTRQTENDRVVRLIDAYRERGDRRALECVLAMHGKILNHVIRRYASSSGEPYEDLLQVGYLERVMDPTRGGRWLDGASGRRRRRSAARPRSLAAARSP